MTATTWSGTKVRRARAYWRPRLPLPCRRCGKPVLATPESGWHVGHIIDRALGGTDHLSNQWPEHNGCNTSAGGKIGARITNARRARPRILSERERGIPNWLNLASFRTRLTAHARGPLPFPTPGVIR